MIRCDLHQSFLKEFGQDGQYFEAIVTQKGDNIVDNSGVYMESGSIPINYHNKYSEKVIESKNVIFRGGPGTGKSFLAKAIATDIVSNGEIQQYTLLSDDQKKQIEFIQFHPSYAYTDFVEGLRPKVNDDGSMGFELQDGVFEKFVAKARKAQNSGVDNFEESWRRLVNQLEVSKFVEVPFALGRRSFPIELNELGTGLATRTYKGEYGVGEWISGKSRFYNKEQLYNIWCAGRHKRESAQLCG